jgi:hypothetical protein
MTILIAIWGLVTLLFFVLLFFRSRITEKESDWIPLSDDAKEEQAIQAQKVSEMKGHKLDFPIRVVGLVSVFMLFFIIGFWLYRGIMTPPPMTK